MDCRLFPAKIDFPPAAEVIGALSGDEAVLRLKADVSGFEDLGDHAAVRALWCFGIDAKRLAVLLAAVRGAFQLRPDIQCSWFRPFLVLDHERCDVCGNSLVMLTGKGQPTLCPYCRADRVERHVARFQEAADAAARQGDAPAGDCHQRTTHRHEDH